MPGREELLPDAEREAGNASLDALNLAQAFMPLVEDPTRPEVAFTSLLDPPPRNAGAPAYRAGGIAGSILRTLTEDVPRHV